MYRDRLTLRQLYTRLAALPREAKTWPIIERWEAEAMAVATERDLHDTLAMVQPRRR